MLAVKSMGTTALLLDDPVITGHKGKTPEELITVPDAPEVDDAVIHTSVS